MFTSFEKSALLNKNAMIREGLHEDSDKNHRDSLDASKKYDLSTYAGFSEAFKDESAENELSDCLDHFLSSGDFHTISRFTQELLIEAGVTEAEQLNPADPAVALALAEAVNLAAKSIDYRFYQLKPAMIVSAWKIGNRFGYNKDDHTYNLFHPKLGTASFHDPGEDINRIIQNILNEPKLEWPYEWSGLQRQDLAFKVLENLKNLKEIEVLIAELIRETTPQPLSGIGIDFQSHGIDTLQKTYGVDSLQVKLRDLILQSENSQLRALFLGCTEHRAAEIIPENEQGLL